MIINYYNSKEKKNALMIYIDDPFKRGANHKHTNQVESLAIARVLKKNKYNVDVLHYQMIEKEMWKIPFKKYDLIISIEYLGLRVAKLLARKECVLIHYATGAWEIFARAAQQKRYKNFMYRTGIQIDSDVKFKKRELLLCNKTLLDVDGIICVGNEWTASTYKHLNDVVYSVPASGFSYKKYTETKIDLEKKKHSFMWFGGRGGVHKGVDLCIEVFKNRPSEKLYIAGPYEEKIFKAYHNEIKFNNIKYVGFLDVKSKKYEKVCGECAFVIFPSCSEGQATSVLTVMAMGLIPIVTREVGISVDGIGFELSDDRIDTINECIEYVLTLSDDEISKRQKAACEYIFRNHSVENFSTIFEEKLMKIIECKNKKFF